MFAKSDFSFSVSEFEGDLAFGLLDPLDTNSDRISQPIGRAAAPADEPGAERVELVVVARHAPGRQIALEGCIPARVEQAALQKPGEAERIGSVLDLRGLALSVRRPLGQVIELVRW